MFLVASFIFPFDCDKIIAIHSEDEQILQKMAALDIGKTFTDHPKVRPVEAAVTSTMKAINLALKYKKRLHILHLSTAEEVKIIRKHNHTNLITAEPMFLIPAKIFLIFVIPVLNKSIAPPLTALPKPLTT